MKKEVVETFIAISIVVGLALGAVSYFAKAEELRLVEMRLDQKINSDQIHETKGLMKELEKTNKGKSVDLWKDQRDKDEYQKLGEELELLKLKREKLLKK